MNKNLHDIDDFFLTALEFQEIIPSPSVSDKLKASLDKADAEYFKKRFLLWKKMAIVLVVLLFVLAILESGILTSRSEKSNRAHAVEQADPAAKNNKPIEKNEVAADDKRNVV